MSEDRELLELAARAFGAAPWVEQQWPGICLSDDPEINPFYVCAKGRSTKAFNSLENAEDALALAAELRIKIIPGKYKGDGASAESQFWDAAGATVFSKKGMLDQICRAVTMVAADIQRKKEAIA